MAEMTRCPPASAGSRIRMPLRARLLLSVPPLVKKISSLSASSAAAVSARASSIAS